ncbi:hypothetical protein Scep_004259 [Stephania cephalantha]|uniref:Uncharacterized protein n=1 Tax=Stephania cephalantha TaxID=152367 RepID=A0AAP0KT10_9MAGN
MRGGGAPYIVRLPFTIVADEEDRWHLHPSDVYAKSMTKVFKREMFTEGQDKDDVTPNDVFLQVNTKDHDKETMADQRGFMQRSRGGVRRTLRLLQTSQWIRSNFATMGRGTAKRGVSMGSGHMAARREDMEISVPTFPESG